MGSRRWRKVTQLENGNRTLLGPHFFLCRAPTVGVWSPLLNLEFTSLIYSLRTRVRSDRLGTGPSLLFLQLQTDAAIRESPHFFSSPVNPFVRLRGVNWHTFRFARVLTLSQNHCFQDPAGGLLPEGYSSFKSFKMDIDEQSTCSDQGNGSGNFFCCAISHFYWEISGSHC